MSNQTKAAQEFDLKELVTMLTIAVLLVFTFSFFFAKFITNAGVLEINNSSWQCTETSFISNQCIELERVK